MVLSNEVFAQFVENMACFTMRASGWEHTPRDVQCATDWIVTQQQNRANRYTGPSDKPSSRVINNVAFLLLDGLYTSHTVVLNFSGCHDWM